MNIKVENALTKVYDLIEKRKKELGGASKPTVHVYEDGAYIHFFDTWENYDGGALGKEVKKVGKYPYNKKPTMIFAKKGTHIPLTKSEIKKTYIIIRGHVDFFFDDDDAIFEMRSLTTTVVPKGKSHGCLARKDTFLMIIEDEN